MLLTFAAIYHVLVHTLRREFSIVPRRGDFKESYLIIKAMLGPSEEPDSHKYLAEQRLAYAFIGANLAFLLIAGYIKVLKNLAGFDLPYEMLWTNTQLHNLATVLLILGVVGHLAAFALKANRPLLPSIFHAPNTHGTGTVHGVKRLRASEVGGHPQPGSFSARWLPYVSCAHDVPHDGCTS